MASSCLSRYKLERACGCLLRAERQSKADGLGEVSPWRRLTKPLYFFFLWLERCDLLWVTCVVTRGMGLCSVAENWNYQHKITNAMSSQVQNCLRR